MNLEYATTLILLAFFAAAEIYRFKRGLRGVIVSVSDPGIPLPVTSVKVRLQAGDEVAAQLNCCTACLGQLKIGDQVRVAPSSDGYVVDLPWFRRSRCADGGETEKCRTQSALGHTCR